MLFSPYTLVGSIAVTAPAFFKYSNSLIAAGGSWQGIKPTASNRCGLAEQYSISQSLHARQSTAEFQALKVSQRPAFELESSIGDRAVFSGLARGAPLVAALDAMLDDAAAYDSFASHFGGPPPG